MCLREAFKNDLLKTYGMSVCPSISQSTICKTIFSPAYRRTLETKVSVTDDDDDVMTLLIELS